jgi:hypothetical protein
MGIDCVVTGTADADDALERTPPAERPRTEEQELARGRVEQTPFSVISWVGLTIGLVVLLVVALVVVAYLVA